MTLNLFYTLLILIFPLNWRLFTVAHLLHGFAAIAFGPNIVFNVAGVLMTVVGLVMAFANGFFRQRMKLKIFIHVALLVLLPIFKTTYTHLEKFHICSLNLFIFWSFFFSYMVMLVAQIYGNNSPIYTTGEENILKIADFIVWNRANFRIAKQGAPYIEKASVQYFP